MQLSEHIIVTVAAVIAALCKAIGTTVVAGPQLAPLRLQVVAVLELRHRVGGNSIRVMQTEAGRWMQEAAALTKRSPLRT